jgi:DNA-3-methyladenine glycosylase
MLEGRETLSKPLPREFFARDGITVAKELLGKILVHETSMGIMRGIITETESYMGVEDKGSHTYGGRRTERTEPMFAEGGHSYVYFTYGMYHCMNITSGREGDPQAVLIRSVVPADEESKERMTELRVAAGEAKALRKLPEDVQGETRTSAEQAVLLKLRKSVEKHLADGPGKMCIAMEITKKDNARDMVGNSDFCVTEGICVKPQDILTGKRIGIDYAEEAADYLWRFYLK